MYILQVMRFQNAVACAKSDYVLIIDIASGGARRLQFVIREIDRELVETAFRSFERNETRE